MVNNKARNKTSIGAIVVIGLSVAVGSVIGGSVVKLLFGSSNISKILVKTADEINRSLPMMVDHLTRWDTTAALPGNRLMYKYTILDMPSQMDEAKLIERLRPNLINIYKTSAAMDDLRSMEVELVYSYFDEKGNQLTSFSISPTDF